MRDLAEGRADAAFFWGPSAGWIDKSMLGGAYAVVPVTGPHMQWRASIGGETGAEDPGLLRGKPNDLPGAVAERRGEATWRSAPGTAIRQTTARSRVEKCSPTPNSSSATPISASCSTTA
jgi:hypothetical protein